MLGPLDAGVVVVVAQVPQIVRTDPQIAAWADWKLAALDATCELGTPASMGRPVHRSLALVLCQPLSSLRRALDLARLRALATRAAPLQSDGPLVERSLGEERDQDECGQDSEYARHDWRHCDDPVWALGSNRRDQGR
jgi:hypothetical protein